MTRMSRLAAYLLLSALYALTLPVALGAGLSDYRGMSIIASPTGVGGVALTNNFKELAERTPPVLSVGAAPTANSDSDNTDTNGACYLGTRWVDTSDAPDAIYHCIDPTPTAAVWVRQVTATTGGAIDLGSEAVTTTGAIAAGAITGTSFVIGGDTLTTTEWGYLDGQDQAIATTSSVVFGGLNVTGPLSLDGTVVLATDNADTGSTNTTLVGKDAGSSNSGSYTTAVGNGAADANTGARVTAVGYGAGGANTGHHLTAVGYLAGAFNTGAENTFIGHNCGDTNTSGAYNLFLGENCATAHLTGSYNVIAGRSAAAALQSGSNNVVMGAGAAGTGTTFAGCVVIGRSAGNANNTDNRLYIDNSSTASPLIYGEFDNNIITINGDLSTTGRLYGGGATVTAAGPTNDVDVSGCNVVYIDTVGNDITIGGFTGGVAGQVIQVVRTRTANKATLEHNEGTGNQDIFLVTEGDDELETYGGWTLVCNGTHWYEVGQ
ncbi:MAG: hypothetical protein GY835_24560 [bacterium]|nr:hypothetical protein [bacterium]